ncbi:MAG: SoxR reducing system RseC family protein [Deferribacteraceae bacterium]|jgi:positive regulator of sigma E activity|nr:SoxR reducing system RseC family protein [Deferribacteraceae bacterium]
MGRDCEVNAVVKEVNGNKIIVETAPDDVCVSCGAKIMCGSAKKRIFAVTLPVSPCVQAARDNKSFRQGDTVCLSVPAKFILILTFTLYIMGAAVGTAATILLSHLFNLSETLAAVLFLLITALWFVLTTVFYGKSADKQIKVS